ncbi:hypothetical protein PLESTB_001481500 [Pleodorina starrii]|uniref:Structural maintenance of chromosomes protein 6 n=1 Tax=Pleodorina starrii TaxID=330485 RepID=A0A9W6BW89_9CHLO|nr:hypothetical protein PLESTM_000653000 [Pleodorina starrii]GLC59394.1 hypothetical protein PLESTB_001481500 [Pleodorina starrii]GLC74407.1 hypothetical protein PLESTF_001509800 [Pleodorina starrii]
MLAVKPQYRKDAKVFCGRRVRKSFFTGAGKKKKDYFFGTVVECPIFHGEVCYSIQYDDGDTEDIAWEELVKIMLPEHQPSTSGLTDATNVTDAHGRHGGNAASRQTSRKQPNGLVTPPTQDEGAEPSEVGTAGQQPRVQRQGRTRKRDVAERDAEPQSHQADCAAGGPGSIRGREAMPDGAEVQGADAEAQAEERPRKRRAGAQAAAEAEEAAAAEAAEDAHQQADQVPLPVPPEGEGDDASGFVSRTRGLAGQVAKIHVENFMCHQHFELEFGSHVTLVSGANGSGKSAVVQALQVCLGVTARNTGRGTGIADLIRSGCPDSKVQVTLWNTGEDAFMPSVFGDRITVERHLKRAGASTYALLDARGRKAALDRGERVKDVLDRMLDHFTVDANNPLTIITQDKSRSLLQDKSNAKDKYEMFMAGTLLDRVQGDLKAANAQVAAMMKNFEETKTRFNAEQQEAAQLNSKVQKLRDADKFLQDREMLERAIAWRAVQQMEERVVVAKDAAETRGPELLDVYDRHIAAVARAKQELIDRQEELAAELVQHDAIMANQTTHAEALLKAQRDARAAMDRAKRSKASAQSNLDTLRNEQKALDEQLAKDNNGKAAEARRLVEEHQQQVTAKRAALNEAVEAFNVATQALEAARSESMELQRQETAERESVQHSAKLVAEFQKQLHELDAAQGNRLGIFNAAGLDDLISRNAHRFHQRPIGPIGALLTVNEPKWRLATEVALGNVFRDYLVSCTTDANLLRELMRQARYQRASVVTSNFAAPLHNIPPARRPANGFMALMDVLMVQDPAAHNPVMNYLVDKFRIEATALAENQQQGQSVNHGQAAGAHISAAIDTGGNWYRRNNELKWTDRNERVKEQHCRLIADVSNYKAALERDLEQREAQLGAQREDLAGLSSRLREARAREAQCDQEVKLASNRRMRAKTDLNRLTAQAPEMPSFEDDEEAGAVLTQLASIQNELAGSQIQLQTAEEGLALAEQAHRQAVQQAREAQARYEERVGDGNRLRQQQSEVAAQMADLDGMRNVAMQNRDTIRVSLEKLRSRVEAADAQLQRALAAADQVCSRAEGEDAIRKARVLVSAVVNKQLARKPQWASMGRDEQLKTQERALEASMDFAGLERHLVNVNKDISKAEAEAGCSDLRELEIRLEAQKKTVETRRRACNRMWEMLQRFQSSYANQVQSFERLRTSLMDITQAKFAKYLRRRDHDGRLEFNHAERTLKLLVKPKGKNNRDAQAVEDLKQLSGGERSFTTVALLLAIGENTESPFRCNDEFDVFMDDVNRRVATETLLEFAMENSAFQYIFLTPQEITTVEDARQQLMKRRRVQLPPTFLRTVKMHPPRENANHA